MKKGLSFLFLHTCKISLHVQKSCIRMLVSRRIANDVMTYVFPNGKTVCTILNVFISYAKTQNFLTYDSSQ